MAVLSVKLIVTNVHLCLIPKCSHFTAKFLVGCNSENLLRMSVSGLKMILHPLGEGDINTKSRLQIIKLSTV